MPDRIESSTTLELESQLRDELRLAFYDLGGVAFALVHHRALSDKRFDPAVKRIYELRAQLDAVTHHLSCGTRLASA